MEEKQEKTEKKRNFFWRNYDRDGKGVDRGDVIVGYNPKNFFKLYFRRFSNIVTINLLYIFGNFPLLFIILGVSGFFSKTSTAPTSILFPFLSGIGTAGGNTSALSVLAGISGMTDRLSVPGTATYILYGIGALVVITFGLVNVGCTYLLRETVRGEHIFVFDDFFSAIKKNFRQGLILGVLDIVFIALCAYADWSYLVNYSNYSLLFFCSLAMTVVYLFIRSYAYLMAVTFDLNIFQIIKNSFIFAILSFGRNFLALAVCAILSVITYSSLYLYLPIGVIIAAMILFSTMTYITLYIQYPRVEELMIEPYLEDHPEERPEKPKQYDQDEKLDPKDLSDGSDYLNG